uniref:Systemic RNA interference defective protein 1 n=2 Tax=Parascaris univalens TaxID=6257 RepID=A0A915BEE9_PARUN
MWMYALISVVCCLVLIPASTQTSPQSVNLIDSEVKHSSIDIKHPKSAAQHQSTTFLPFTLKRKHVEYSVISAGDRNVHTTTLNHANLIDLLRIRIRLNTKCEGYNLMQVLCDHPSDSTTFFLPTEYGGSEAVAMLGGVMLEDLIANGDQPENLTITITSRSKQPLNYTLIVGFLDRSQYNVELPPKKVSRNGLSKSIKSVENQTCSAVEPISFKLTVDRSIISSLSVVFKSTDDVCAVASLQHTTHHLIQSASLALTSSSHITFNRFATLKVRLDELPTSFSLLIFAFGNDTICDPNAHPREFAKKKKFSIYFSTEPPPSLALPTVSMVLFYAFVPLLFFGMTNWASRKRNLVSSQTTDLELAPCARTFLEQGTEEVEMESVKGIAEYTGVEITTLKSGEEVDLHSLEERIQNESNNCENRIIVQQSAVAPILVEGSDSALSYFLIAPVGLQLFFTLFTERIRNDSDEDTCYHNYECSYSWGPFRSFNHIVSNFGYLAMGATYCVFLQQWKRTHDGSSSTGVELCFMVLYGIGSALGTEALTSSLYHICPNSNAFHFDTPYIEVICVLVMMGLYGARHGGISSSLSIAFVCAVLFYHTLWGFSSLQPMLSAGQLIIVFVMESKVFFGGHLRFDLTQPRASVKRVFALWHLFLESDVKTTLLVKRMIILSLIFIANVALVLVVFLNVASRSTHFVLYCSAANMTLYFIYYFINKMMCGESLPVFAFFSWSIGTVFWAIAWYFFSRSETDWMATAAQSRALNRACTLLGFYDAHDLCKKESQWKVMRSFCMLERSNNR